MHVVDIPDWAIEHGRLMNHFTEIDPRRTALLVVDMQNAFMTPGQPLANATTREIVPNINRLAIAAREAGTPLFWSRQSHVTEGPGALPEWQRQNDKMTAMSAESLTPGNFGHALNAELDVDASDTVFDKYRYSCFYNAAIDLDAELRRRGIDTVIVTGTVTNCCCETTARDAVMRGYRTFFLSDATAALTDAEHNAALFNLRLAFADVRTTDEVIGLFADAKVH